MRTPAAMTRRRSIGDHFVRRRRNVRISVRHTRFVALMKVALPISAVAIVVLVVAWPYLTRQEEGFHLSISDIGVNPGKGMYMTNVRFFDSDDKGQPFSLTAKSLSQDNDDPDLVRLTLPAADIEFENGAWVVLTAARGALHKADQTLLLEGEVNLFTDAGYELRTEQIEINLRAKTAQGDVPVAGQGPLGVLTADRFSLDQARGSILFEGRVRMVLYLNAGA